MTIVENLREVAKDLRWTARHVMSNSPHTSAEEIAEMLDGAEETDRRANELEAAGR